MMTDISAARSLVERLAIPPDDTDANPALRLTAGDCADVLASIAAERTARAGHLTQPSGTGAG